MFVKIMTVLAALCVLIVGGMVFLGMDLRDVVALGSSFGKSPEVPGVTVLSRQPFDRNASAPPPPKVKPVEQAEPREYAMELGGAQSFSELSTRFARIAGQNAEAGFDHLEPRATLRDTLEGLEARLLVGPFATQADALAACGGLALPQDILCRAVPFEGEVIARQ